MERVLATRPSEVVARAEVKGLPAAVRVLAHPDDAALAEWTALASIASEHVAGFLDWGVLGGAAADGGDGDVSPGLWVARRWIEGQSLDRFAQNADPDAIAKAVAGVFRALEDVHFAGFVHGDLSPGNVIVDADGRGFLTDFGMASAVAGVEGHRRLRRSGTPLFMAPEVLVGGAPTELSDLFSLAAVLALTLTGVDIDPARFYGRFPAEPFLAAAEIDIDGLPRWSRRLLSTLLARSPEKRRTGDGSWAERLVAEIGGAGPGQVIPRARALGALEGRELFAKELISSPLGLTLVTTVDADEAVEVVDALAIAMLQAGRHVRRLDAEELARNSRTTLDVDRLIAAETPDRPESIGTSSSAAAEPLPILLVSVTSVDAWTLDVLDILGHTAAAGRRWIVLGFVAKLPSGRLARKGSPWGAARRVDLPAVTGSLLSDALRARVVFPEEEADWIDLLDRVGQGSVTRLNHTLGRAASLGAFQAVDGEVLGDGAQRVAVHPSFRWEVLMATKDQQLPPGLSELERRVVAALVFLGGAAARHTLSRLVGEEIPAQLAALERVGLVTARGTGQIRLLGSVPELADFGLKPEALRSLHAGAAEAQRPGDPETWVHLLGAAERSDAAAVERVHGFVRGLDRRGLRAQIVRGLTWARSVLESQHRFLAPALMAELALALARNGEAAAARSTAKLAGDSMALAEVEGILAHVAGDLEGSASAFRRAARPLQALAEEAHAMRGRGDQAGFERVVAEAAALDPEAERGGSGAWVDILGIRADASAQVGDTSVAQGFLDEALDLAGRSGGSLVEATVHMNRAALARTTGDGAASRREILRARELFQSVGFAAGEAQAQAFLGMLLKSEGHLAAAEQPLSSAVGRRERLGARAAAAMTRGTLGILLLERGHLFRAMEELQRARATLTEERLTGVAELVAAALDLALARVGCPALAVEQASTSLSDERIARWHGLAACLRGDGGAADADVSHLADAEQADDAALIRECASAPPRHDAVTRLLERARERVDQGRDAAAARLAIEAMQGAAAVGAAALEREANEIVSARLGRVLQYLSADEAQRAELTLLGLPDPAPESLDRWRSRLDDDMDVLKILELNERLVRQEDTSTLLGSIVEAALEVSGAERGFIVMCLDGKLALDTAFDSSRGDVGDQDVHYSRSIVEEALDGRKTLRVSDAVEHDQWMGARSVEDLRLRSILAAPFFVSPRMSGVVVVDDRTRPGAFGPREERLLTLLGGQAALAMRQVHRLEENRRLASELRRRVVTQEAQIEQANRALDRASVVAPIEGLLGESRAMDEVRSLIHRVARADIATLITGPSGSGKEVAARAMHSLSSRRKAPFVAENCAALPPSLAESELFGVKKGAFTGADHDRAGLFERAEGGTLFLDEIGELPLELQAKLLRVLETRRVRRVGEENERAVDFRLVSATNRDLASEAQEERFREDLMYRLDGVTVQMPALAERAEDIPILVQHFLTLDAPDGEAPRAISPGVMRRLMDRAWPGNVRELANEVARLLVLSPGDITDPDLVRDPAAVRHGSAEGSMVTAGALGTPTVADIRPIAELERSAIFDAMKATGGDKREAAKLLGISRAKIYQRLKEWGES